MSRELFDAGFLQLCQAIDLCIKSKLISPALILLYSAIDIAGYLNNEAPSVKTRFTGWVDEYLLRAKKLGCTSLELYAARCGVVHTFSANSQLSEEGKARRIVYAWGTSEVETLQQMIDIAQMSNWMPVQVEELFAAFRLGVDLFARDLASDPLRASQIYEKAGKFFKPMSEGEGQALLKWAKDLLDNR